MTDYYSVLGVSRKASDKDIRRLYRKLARQLHPDLNPKDKVAEERFKEINEAYEVLSDPLSRRKYDQFGENWRHADQFHNRRQSSGSGGSGFHWPFGNENMGNVNDFQRAGGGDTIFQRLFSDARPSQGSPISQELPVKVTLEEAFSGTIRRIKIHGDATGSSSRMLDVKIPRGVNTGTRVHIPMERKNKQDLYLKVTVAPHPNFQCREKDLYFEAKVPVEDLILGGEVKIILLKGSVLLKIPPETHNGQQFRLSGKGMPHLKKPETFGNLYVTVQAVLPEGLTGEERELFQKLKEMRSTRR